MNGKNISKQIKKLTVKLEEIKRSIYTERMSSTPFSEDNSIIEDLLASEVILQNKIRELSRKRNSSELRAPEIFLLEDENGFKQTVSIAGDTPEPSLGRISNKSPLGKALLSKSESSSVRVKTPRGMIRYRIVARKSRLN